MSWEVTVIDRGFEVVYAVEAGSAVQAKRAARAFFGIEARIVKARRVPS